MSTHLFDAAPGAHQVGRKISKGVRKHRPTMDGEEDGPSKLDRLADTGRTQEQHVSGMELRAQIQEALKQVSPELREAVILRDLQDMDYKEIAEVLAIPQGTVKSSISRGRAELARLLERTKGQVM